MTLKIQDFEEDLAMTENSTKSIFHCIQLSMSKSKKKMTSYIFYAPDIPIARPVITYLKFSKLCKDVLVPAMFCH